MSVILIDEFANEACSGTRCVYHGHFPARGYSRSGAGRITACQPDAHTAWTVRDEFSQTQHQSRLFRVDPGVDPTEVTFVGPLGGTGTIVFARFGPEFVAQTS